MTRYYERKKKKKKANHTLFRTYENAPVLLVGLNLLRHPPHGETRREATRPARGVRRLTLRLMTSCRYEQPYLAVGLILAI